MTFYRILFYGGIACGIIFLILTIVLFFVLKIPAVFGNLSGSTQRKRIEEIRKTGYESVSKKKAIHDSTSRITVREAESKSADSGTLEEKKETKKDNKPKYVPRPDVGFGKVNDDAETELLGYNEYKIGESGPKKEAPKANDYDAESTEILREGDEMSSGGSLDDETTDVLRGNTGSLRSDDPVNNEEETAILGSEAGSEELYDDDLDEDVTAVLTGEELDGESGGFTARTAAGRKQSKGTAAFDEDETDVLTAAEQGAAMTASRRAEAQGAAMTASRRAEAQKEEAEKITGDIGEDITSVLTSHDRTDVVNDMGSNIGSTDEMSTDADDDEDYMEKITVLYSATVVNTGEELDD